MKKLLFILLAISILAISCGEKKEGRRGINYEELKGNLQLTEEQSSQFDAVRAKYQKIGEEMRAAAKAEGGKFDRVEAFKKMEERNKQQTEEMAAFLDEGQLSTYKAFMEKHARKRPRYNDETLAKIKADLALTEEQANVLEAANNAFEQSFQDAHDIYHGNRELAQEYWIKFDEERKKAMKSVLSEEQYAQFLELVKPFDRSKIKE